MVERKRGLRRSTVAVFYLGAPIKSYLATVALHNEYQSKTVIRSTLKFSIFSNIQSYSHIPLVRTVQR